MERIEPNRVLPVIYAEHWHRYLWAASLSRGVVLDAACGVGYGSRAICRAEGVSAYHGIDVSEEAVATAQRDYADPKAAFLAGDLRKLPFEDATFDTIVSLETLEHLEDPGAAVEEFRRVLRPGGRLLGSVPDPEFESACVAAYGPNEFHKATISRERLGELLAAFGRVRMWRSGLEIVSILRPEEDQAAGGAAFEAEWDGPRAFGSILFLAGEERPTKTRVSTRILAAAPLVEHDRLNLTPRLVEIRNLSAQLDQRGARIEELKGYIASLEQKLAERNETIGRQAKLLDERTSLIRKQDGLIAERTAAVHKAQEMVRARDQAMRAQARMIDERAAIIKRQDEIIADRNRTIADQARLVDERAALLRKQDEIIADIRGALRATEAMVNERDEAIRNQTRLIDERTAYIRKLEAMVNERAEAIRNQTRLIDERTAYIRKLEAMVNERAEAMKNQARLIDERTAYIRTLEAMVSENAEAVRKQAGAIEDLQAQAERLGAALEGERALLAERTAEAASLRARGDELAEALSRTRAELDYLLAQLRRPVFCVRKTVRAIIGPPRRVNGRESVVS